MKNVQEVRRKYTKARRIGTVLVFVSFVFFIAASIIVQEFSDPKGWMLWVAVGLFAVCAIGFIAVCRCPFCGRSIIVGVMTCVNCPHCKKQLVEPKAGKKSRLPAGKDRL